MPTPYSLLYGNPLAISDDGFDRIRVAIRREREIDQSAFEAARSRRAQQRAAVMGARPLIEGRDAYVMDGVAVIPLLGPLVRHATLFEDVSALTSYATTARLLDAAMADAGVKSVLLRIDSPGGEAMGTRAVAEKVRAVSGAKPVTAHIEGTGASAAWWIGCGAGRIVADPASEVGSIGVRIVVTDDAKAQQARGEEEIEIINSQSPGKRATPIDDDVRARYQRRANELADIFLGDVARYRGVTLEEVVERFGAGDVLIALRARAVGMIDGLASFDATLAELRAQSKTSERVQMSVQIEPTTEPQAGASPRASVAPTAAVAPPVAAIADEKCDGCGREMARDEKIFCAGCKEDGAGAAAIADRARLVAACGVASVDEALGSIAAWRQEASAARDLRAALETHRADARMQQFGAGLGAAVAAGRVTVADLTTTVPAFFEDANREAAERAIASLGAADGSSGSKVAAAIVSAVRLSEGEANRLGAYLTRKQPAALPAPRQEPDRSPASESQALQDDVISRAAANARAVLDKNHARATAPAAQ